MYSILGGPTNRKPKKAIRVKKERIELDHPDQEITDMSTIPTSSVHFVDDTKTVITVMSSDDMVSRF